MSIASGRKDKEVELSEPGFNRTDSGKSDNGLLNIPTVSFDRFGSDQSQDDSSSLNSLRGSKLFTDSFEFDASSITNLTSHQTVTDTAFSDSDLKPVLVGKLVPDLKSEPPEDTDVQMARDSETFPNVTPQTHSPSSAQEHEPADSKSEKDESNKRKAPDNLEQSAPKRHTGVARGDALETVVMEDENSEAYKEGVNILKRQNDEFELLIEKMTQSANDFHKLILNNLEFFESKNRNEEETNHISEVCLFLDFDNRDKYVAKFQKIKKDANLDQATRIEGLQKCIHKLKANIKFLEEERLPLIKGKLADHLIQPYIDLLKLNIEFFIKVMKTYDQTKQKKILTEMKSRVPNLGHIFNQYYAQPQPEKDMCKVPDQSHSRGQFRSENFQVGGSSHFAAKTTLQSRLAMDQSKTPSLT